jgi:hypothetical protein
MQTIVTFTVVPHPGNDSDDVRNEMEEVEIFSGKIVDFHVEEIEDDNAEKSELQS